MSLYTASLRVILVVGLAVPTFGQNVSQRAVVDASGFRVERVAAEFGEAPGFLPRSGLLWMYDGPNAAIAESVACSEGQRGGPGASWIGWNLNNESFSYLVTKGPGTPAFEYFIPEPNLYGVAVAAPTDAALGLLALYPAPGNGPVIVRAFTPAGGLLPIWTYTFPEEYLITQHRMVDASANGSKVLALANINSPDPNLLATYAVVLNGATGAVLKTAVFQPPLSRCELSDDGSRAVLTQGATARIVETTNLTTLHTFNVSGSGGYARISRDGKVVAFGGFNYQAWKENAGVWSPIWSRSEANVWLGNALALSADGHYLWCSSFKYTNYLEVTHRCIDLVALQEINRSTSIGTGSYQDVPVGAEASDDGNYFCVGSWGTQDNVHPEIQVFNRQAQQIGSVDPPGSCFSIAMTRDGRHVVAGTKAVHANTFGNGGEAYAYEVFGGCPCVGIHATGVCATNQDAIDTVLFNYHRPPGGPYTNGDLDGDGDVDQDDIDLVLFDYGCAG